jgi:tetratricopeptide (TPR) repeat protein
MLDAAAPRLEKGWRDDPQIEATLRTSLGASYVAVQRLDQAKTQLEKARDEFHTLGKTAEEARALYWLASNAGSSGVHAESVRYYREALALLNHLGKNAPPLLVFRTKADMADYLSAVLNRDLDDARKLVAEAIELAAREPSIPRADLAVALTTQGGMLLNEGKTAEAEATFRKALEVFDREHFEGLQRSRPLYHLMILNSRRGDFAAAKEFARQYYEVMLRNIGPDHPRTAEGKILWATYRADTGEAKQAAEQALEAMLLARKGLPALSATLWTPLVCLSHILNLAGRFEEAERYAREALAVVDAQHLPEVDARRAQTLCNLGQALQGEKKHREATDMLDRSARIYEQLGPNWAKRAEQVRKMIESPGRRSTP